MTFTYEDLSPDVRIYRGDCLEVLPTLEAGSVDAVVTDPPFGIGFKYESHDDTPEGYGAWLWSIIEMAESKCNPGSPLFVWQAMLNIRNLAAWFPREWRLFAACKNWVQMRPTPMQYAFDPVVVWWTAREAYSEGTLSRDFHVGVTSPSVHSGLDNVSGHPCPRPLSQVRHIVNQWVRPGGTVVDPFLGSGTTLVACVQLGRKGIGIEIESKYYDISRKRISDALLQGRLL